MEHYKSYMNCDSAWPLHAVSPNAHFPGDILTSNKRVRDLYIAIEAATRGEGKYQSVDWGWSTTINVVF